MVCPERIRRYSDDVFGWGIRKESGGNPKVFGWCIRMGCKMNRRQRSRPIPAGADRRAGSFKDLEATELYCPRCKQSNPVKKSLLLVLPEGEKYEYRCAFCAEPVGSKTDQRRKSLSIIA